MVNAFEYVTCTVYCTIKNINKSILRLLFALIQGYLGWRVSDSHQTLSHNLETIFTLPTCILTTQKITHTKAQPHHNQKMWSPWKTQYVV